MRYTGMRQEYINAHIDARLLALECPTDYEAKYNELCSTIATQLTALKPWYIGGKVGSPMDAVEALKNIDRAVSQ